jgi:deoxyadenosine/deoxycytidine kinase
MLEPQVPTPDLVLYLVADLDTCMGRIRKRQRTFERNMSEEYMRQLLDAYNHFYHHYSRSPLLVVDTRRLNFPDRPSDFEELVSQLMKPIKGTQYYVPMGGR